jgi:hypothetical protein
MKRVNANFLGASVVFAALAACVEPEGGGAVVTAPSQAVAKSDRATLRAPLETEMIEFAFSPAVAKALAGKCSRYRFNSGKLKSDTKALADALEARGYTAADVHHLDRNIPKEKLQKKMIEWIERRSVVVSDKSSFCTAGDAEITEKTDISKYLIART